MRLMILALAILSSCTVYKSSDRDDFDSNGKARAIAAGTTTKPTLSLDDRDLLVDPCSAFNTLTDEEITQLFGSNAHLSSRNQVSQKTSTCFVTSQSADLSAPSLLACSWKPANGQVIPVIGNTAHTTEDDLRRNGFDVVSATVARGQTLRMNCEAYVTTDSLLDDRKNGEPETDALTARFRIFTRALATQTLPAKSRTNTQH